MIRFKSYRPVMVKSGRHASQNCFGHAIVMGNLDIGLTGVTATMSNRQSSPVRSRLRAIHNSAALPIRPCALGVTASRHCSRVARAFTSTKVTSLPRRAIRSISPDGVRARRARMEYPFNISRSAAACSARRPRFSACLRSAIGLQVKRQLVDVALR